MICTQILPAQTAQMLKKMNQILLISHKKPDGDTLGSAFALLYALRSLGKTVRIACSDGFPRRYAFFYPNFAAEAQPEFEPDFVVTVDMADSQLLGIQNECWADRIDLCIDHHPSNTRYARYLLLETQTSSTTAIVAKVLDEMGVPIQGLIGDALYTGLITDTGCFRYANTNADALRLGARLLDAGVDGFSIQKRLLETKSRGLLQLERIALDSLEYAFDERFAMIEVSLDARAKTGVLEEEMEGISQIPRQIEGVQAAATFKQIEPEAYRISLRTDATINASEVCKKFGGGGHPRAAGCVMHGDIQQLKAQLLEVIRPYFL